MPQEIGLRGLEKNKSGDCEYFPQPGRRLCGYISMMGGWPYIVVDGKYVRIEKGTIVFSDAMHRRCVYKINI